MSRRAFTLAELIVTLALVALVTVGIGRLFSTIGGVVGRGVAVSELNQLARTVEDQMRADLERFNSMRSEDTFLVIRQVELGGDPDRPIYLSREDREADIREGLEPYEDGSRAVTRRLDEVAFLAAAPGGAAPFRSQQPNDQFTSGTASAEGARIYYGHGLRPKPDPDWPPEDPDALGAPRVPRRQFEADGYFGQPPGPDPNPSAGVVTGRNQYAAEWILTRQALLLAGGEASGPRTSGSRPRYGRGREFAPYVRDFETLARLWEEGPFNAPSGGAELVAWPGPVTSFWAEVAGGGGAACPDPRLIRHGRVDVSAQSLEDVKRWLEGESPEWNPADPGTVYRATPFTPGEGRFGAPPSSFPEDPYENEGQAFDASALTGTNNTAALQRWLWQRRRDNDSAYNPPQNPIPTPPPLDDFGDNVTTLQGNLAAIRTAIAGVLSRPLVDDDPRPIDRVDDATLVASDPELYAQTNDATMDLHAALAPRCSNFEVAWSDGARWARDMDLDNDGVEDDATAGSLVWYDVTRRDPLDQPNDTDADRMTHAHLWRDFGDAGLNRVNTSNIEWATVYEEIPELTARVDNSDNLTASFLREQSPEAGFGEDLASIPPQTDEAGFPIGLFRKTGFGSLVEGSPLTVPFYNPDITGGVPSPDVWTGDLPEDFNEYVAVWPFRVPQSDGRWTRTWDKRLWLRVRMTLHDPQQRIEGGREYEFIFSVSPRTEPR